MPKRAVVTPCLLALALAASPARAVDGREILRKMDDLWRGNSSAAANRLAPERHLDRHQKLPVIDLFDDFRSIFIFDMNFAPLLKDEQGLMLFLLHRINPEVLLFSPEYFYECENTTEETRRAFLVSEWNYLYGEDAPAGIFERLIEKLFTT